MADSVNNLAGKPISSLTVKDLKCELEKRGLPKSGSKKELQERLKVKLHLEKLQEESIHNEDRVPNLGLQNDIIASQNDFIKQYLAGQQIIYEKQKEARRLIELDEQRSDQEASSSQDESTPTSQVFESKSKILEKKAKVLPIAESKKLEIVLSPDVKEETLPAERRQTRSARNKQNVVDKEALVATDQPVTEGDTVAADPVTQRLIISPKKRKLENIIPDPIESNAKRKSLDSVSTDDSKKIKLGDAEACEKSNSERLLTANETSSVSAEAVQQPELQTTRGRYARNAKQSPKFSSPTELEDSSPTRETQPPKFPKRKGRIVKNAVKQSIDQEITKEEVAEVVSSPQDVVETKLQKGKGRSPRNVKVTSEVVPQEQALESNTSVESLESTVQKFKGRNVKNIKPNPEIVFKPAVAKKSSPMAALSRSTNQASNAKSRNARNAKPLSEENEDAPVDKLDVEVDTGQPTNDMQTTRGRIVRNRRSSVEINYFPDSPEESSEEELLKPPSALQRSKKNARNAKQASEEVDPLQLTDNDGKTEILTSEIQKSKGRNFRQFKPNKEIVFQSESDNVKKAELPVKTYSRLSRPKGKFFKSEQEAAVEAELSETTQSKLPKQTTKDAASTNPEKSQPTSDIQKVEVAKKEKHDANRLPVENAKSKMKQSQKMAENIEPVLPKDLKTKKGKEDHGKKKAPDKNKHNTTDKPSNSKTHYQRPLLREDDSYGESIEDIQRFLSSQDEPKSEAPQTTDPQGQQRISSSTQQIVKSAEMPKLSKEATPTTEEQKKSNCEGAHSTNSNSTTPELQNSRDKSQTEEIPPVSTAKSSSTQQEGDKSQQKVKNEDATISSKGEETETKCSTGKEGETSTKKESAVETKPVQEGHCQEHQEEESLIREEHIIHDEKPLSILSNNENVSKIVTAQSSSTVDSKPRPKDCENRTPSIESHQTKEEPTPDCGSSMYMFNTGKLSHMKEPLCNQSDVTIDSEKSIVSFTPGGNELHCKTVIHSDDGSKGEDSDKKNQRKEESTSEDEGCHDQNIEDTALDLKVITQEVAKTSIEKFSHDDELYPECPQPESKNQVLELKLGNRKKQLSEVSSKYAVNQVFEDLSMSRTSFTNSVLPQKSEAVPVHYFEIAKNNALNLAVTENIINRDKSEIAVAMVEKKKEKIDILEMLVADVIKPNKTELMPDFQTNYPVGAAVSYSDASVNYLSDCQPAKVPDIPQASMQMGVLRQMQTLSNDPRDKQHSVIVVGTVDSKETIANNSSGLKAKLGETETPSRHPSEETAGHYKSASTLSKMVPHHLDDNEPRVYFAPKMDKEEKPKDLSCNAAALDKSVKSFEISASKNKSSSLHRLLEEKALTKNDSLEGGHIEKSNTKTRNFLHRSTNSQTEEKHQIGSNEIIPSKLRNELLNTEKHANVENCRKNLTASFEFSAIDMSIRNSSRKECVATSADPVMTCLTELDSPVGKASGTIATENKQKSVMSEDCITVTKKTSKTSDDITAAVGVDLAKEEVKVISNDAVNVSCDVTSIISQSKSAVEPVKKGLTLIDRNAITKSNANSKVCYSCGLEVDKLSQHDCQNVDKGCVDNVEFPHDNRTKLNADGREHSVIMFSSSNCEKSTEAEAKKILSNEELVSDVLSQNSLKAVSLVLPETEISDSIVDTSEGPLLHTTVDVKECDADISRPINKCIQHMTDVVHNLINITERIASAPIESTHSLQSSECTSDTCHLVLKDLISKCTNDETHSTTEKEDNDKRVDCFTNHIVTSTLSKELLVKNVIEDSAERTDTVFHESKAPSVLKQEETNTVLDFSMSTRMCQPEHDEKCEPDSKKHSDSVKHDNVNTANCDALDTRVFASEPVHECIKEVTETVDSVIYMTERVSTVHKSSEMVSDTLYSTPAAEGKNKKPDCLRNFGYSSTLSGGFSVDNEISSKHQIGIGLKVDRPSTACGQEQTNASVNFSEPTKQHQSEHSEDCEPASEKLAANFVPEARATDHAIENKLEFPSFKEINVPLEDNVTVSEPVSKCMQEMTETVDSVIYLTETVDMNRRRTTTPYKQESVDVCSNLSKSFKKCESDGEFEAESNIRVDDAVSCKTEPTDSCIGGEGFLECRKDEVDLKKCISEPVSECIEEATEVVDILNHATGLIEQPISQSINAFKQVEEESFSNKSDGSSCSETKIEQVCGGTEEENNKVLPIEKVSTSTKNLDSALSVKERENIAEICDLACLKKRFSTNDDEQFQEINSNILDQLLQKEGNESIDKTEILQVHETDCISYSSSNEADFSTEDKQDLQIPEKMDNIPLKESVFSVLESEKNFGKDANDDLIAKVDRTGIGDLKHKSILQENVLIDGGLTVQITQYSKQNIDINPPSSQLLEVDRTNIEIPKCSDSFKEDILTDELLTDKTKILPPSSQTRMQATEDGTGIELNSPTSVEVSNTGMSKRHEILQSNIFTSELLTEGETKNLPCSEPSYKQTEDSNQQSTNVDLNPQISQHLEVATISFEVPKRHKILQESVSTDEFFKRKTTDDNNQYTDFPEASKLLPKRTDKKCLESKLRTEELFEDVLSEEASRKIILPHVVTKETSEVLRLSEKEKTCKQECATFDTRPKSSQSRSSGNPKDLTESFQHSPTMVGRKVKRTFSSKAPSDIDLAAEQVTESVPKAATKEDITLSSPRGENDNEKEPRAEEENGTSLPQKEVGNNKNCSDDGDRKDNEKLVDTVEDGDFGRSKPSDDDGKETSNFKDKRKFSSSSEGSSSRSPSPVGSRHKQRHLSTSGSSSDEKEAFPPSRNRAKRLNRETPDSGNYTSEPKDSEISSEKGDLESKGKHSRSVDDDCSLETNESLLQDVDSKRSLEKEEKRQSKKIHTRKLSLSGSRESEKEDNSEGKVPRKRKWGALTKAVPKALPSISTESLKDLIPDYKPTTSSGPENPHSEVMSVDEDPIVEERPHVHVHVTSPKPSPKRHSSNTVHVPEVEKHKAPIREEILPPSPPKNPTSAIIHIRNLVRPFTLHQLKEELGKTGTLVENSFWIDKIKSKCYVTYETEEQAAATRQALHGARWPTSNPKTLTVDFSTKDELEFHKDLGDIPAVQKPEISVEVQKDVRHVNQELHPMPEPMPRRPSEKDERSRGRREKERIKEVPIREWDRDKLNQDMPTNDEKGKDRARERDRGDRDRDLGHGPRPRERRDKVEKKEAKKKHEEETPAKLLDDLFRKTKTTPCIYWLPLTEEQREEAKKHREEEREKRRQRINQEGKEPQPAETDRRPRVRERDNRPVRDSRDVTRRSRSRSPGRRR